MELVLWSSGDDPALALVGSVMCAASFTAGAAPKADWGRAHDALFRPHVSEAYIAIDAQIRAVEILSRSVASSPERAYVERCVAHVERVRDALHVLHSGAVDAKTRGYDYEKSPLGAYLVTAHLWCRDMLEGLRRQASMHQAAAISDGEALSDRSSTYVIRYVEPLYREILLSCAADRAATPDADTLSPVVQRAERVHAEIVRWSWALDG